MQEEPITEQGMFPDVTQQGRGGPAPMSVAEQKLWGLVCARANSDLSPPGTGGGGAQGKHGQSLAPHHSCCSLPACLFSPRPPGSGWCDPHQHLTPAGTLCLLGQGCWRCGPVPPPALQQEPSSAEEHHSGAKHPQFHVPGAVPWHSVLPEGDQPCWPLQVLVTLCHRVDM